MLLIRIKLNGNDFQNIRSILFKKKDKENLGEEKVQVLSKKPGRLDGSEKK